MKHGGSMAKNSGKEDAFKTMEMSMKGNFYISLLIDISNLRKDTDMEFMSKLMGISTKDIGNKTFETEKVSKKQLMEIFMKVKL